MDVLLCGTASGRLERIARVTRPAAGEVPAVLRIAAPSHADLVAVVEQRRAACGEQEGPRELEPGDVRTAVAHEAPNIVQAEEGDERLRVLVQTVACERFGEPADRAPLGEGTADGIEEREIEERVDARIDPVPLRDAALMKGDDRRIAVIDLAHDAQGREFPLDRRHPWLPEAARHVGPGILPDPVQAAHRDPPERVLREVACDLGVVLIQIGEDVEEPSIHRRLLHGGSGVWVGDRPGLPSVVGMLRRGPVEPGRRRRIHHPRVVPPRVIGHHVGNHLDAHGMRLVHERAEPGEVAEVLFDRVEVGRAIAVVVGHRLPVVDLLAIELVVVVEDRIQPDGGDAEFLEVGQALAYAGEVSAMVEARLVALQQAARDDGIVVGGVSVGEPVRHDQIDHVVLAEALESTAPSERCGELEARIGTAAGRAQRERIAPRGRRTGDRHVREHIGAGGVHLQVRAGQPPAFEPRA